LEIALRNAKALQRTQRCRKRASNQVYIYLSILNRKKYI